MKLFRILRTGVTNLYFLFFLNGFLVCLFVNFEMADNYEKRIFSSLANNILAKTQNMPEDSVLAAMLHATNFLVGSRSSVFKPGVNNPASYTQDYTASLTGDLMTAQGACGSYSKVMVKLAQELNFDCRIGQMKVKGVYGGHIIPEVKTSKGWVVIDPMYDLFFKNSKGESASFKEVSGNWNYYKQQVPAEYNLSYSYEDVRYTNWQKIPVILPSIKKLLDFSIGEQRANDICLSVELLSIYNIYSILLLLIIVPLSIHLLIRIFRRHAFQLYPGLNRDNARFPVLARMLTKSDKPE
jgi:hypothetical protein